MRYIIQLLVMLGDVVLLFCCAVLIVFLPLNPIAWLLVGVGFYCWLIGGGAMAWRPSIIKRFMVNAKKLGL